MHQHTQHHRGRFQSTKHLTLIGAVINVILGLLKVVFGVLGHSSALIADGVHSFSDLLCNLLVVVAAYFGDGAADEDHPYGHRRFETAATFLLGIILMITALLIAYESVMRIVHHQLLIPDAYTIAIAMISIFANEWFYRYSMLIAKQHNSALLKANAWHSRGDALSSVIVLLGLLGSIAGWPFLDSVAAVIVALLIGKIGIEWSWKAFGEFTEKGLAPELLREMGDCIRSVDGVITLHQLRSRTMADSVLLDVHILIDKTLTASEGHYIAESAHVALAKHFPEMTDVTIHVDVENHPHVLPTKLLPSRKKILTLLEPCWAAFIDLEKIAAVDLYYENERYLDICIVVQGVSEAELKNLIPQFKGAGAVIAALRKIDVFLKLS